MAWNDPYSSGEMLTPEELLQMYANPYYYTGLDNQWWLQPSAGPPPPTTYVPTTTTVPPTTTVAPRTTTVAPTTTTTSPRPSTPSTGGSTGGYSYAGIDTSGIPRTVVRPSMPTGGASGSSPTTGVVSDANLFEQRAKAASLADQAIQATLGDTAGGMTADEYNRMRDEALYGPTTTNNGSGPSQTVLSPAQVKSLIDSLTAQTATAGQGVGAAYDQANKEMARLMRQYSRAEKMNRAGAQGTLTAFGVRPNAYKVGDFGAPEMLAGARADLIGNKAAEMSNWANQKALYQQLLKDMGG